MGHEISYPKKDINPIYFQTDRIDQGSKVIFAMLSNIDKHEYVVRIAFGNAKNYFLKIIHPKFGCGNGCDGYLGW